jgi:nucleoside-diphosphate-sugar epimerase
MKVLVAGATGVVGRPLVRRLLDAGHEVFGTTGSTERAAALEEVGAWPLLVDVRDAAALGKAMGQAQPEVVVNELTRYPRRFNYRKPEETFGPTIELRGVVSPILAGAAAEAGARRLVSQSVCFFYRPTGVSAHPEQDRMLELPPGPSGASMTTALAQLERSTLETAGLEGVVLRYGYFYGPDTHYASDGYIADDVRKRRFQIVGRGTGIFSFVHLEDAAAATVAAVERASPGIYNVCDDDPAPMAEWLPVYAEAIGAKQPWRVPVWLARLVAGSQVSVLAQLEGASNAKAKRELGWKPKYPSWREGFKEGLG